MPQEKLETSNLASEADFESVLSDLLLVYGKLTNVHGKRATLNLPTEADFESFLCSEPKRNKRHQWTNQTKAEDDDDNTLKFKLEGQ